MVRSMLTEDNCVWNVLQANPLWDLFVVVLYRSKTFTLRSGRNTTVNRSVCEFALGSVPEKTGIQK